MDERARETGQEQVILNQNSEDKACTKLRKLIERCSEAHEVNGRHPASFDVDELESALLEVFESRIDSCKIELDDFALNWKMLKKKRHVKRLNQRLTPTDLLRLSIFTESHYLSERMRDSILISLLVQVIFAVARDSRETDAMRDSMAILSPTLKRYADYLRSIETTKEDQKKKQSEMNRLYIS